MLAGITIARLSDVRLAAVEAYDQQKAHVGVIEAKSVTLKAHLKACEEGLNQAKSKAKARAQQQHSALVQELDAARVRHKQAKSAYEIAIRVENAAFSGARGQARARRDQKCLVIDANVRDFERQQNALIKEAEEVRDRELTDKGVDTVKLIHGGRAKWRELVDMRQSGDERDKAQIEESLSYTLNEMVYFMGQNLQLLNHQTATDYGNVESMKRKLRQNHFYADSVKTLINELNQLQEFVETVDNEALAYGLYEMRQMVNVRVKVRMADWRVKLNDIQASISKRLFVKRRVDRELKVLDDTVLWMVRNPTLDGFEIELGGQSLARSINANNHPQIAALWALMKSLQKGLPQEWMRDL